ncbi:MAG: N-acetylmuramoyl-L-alanine amidase [Phycisphaeraceae bacterium]|nr:N-acetylmuramoyl-L-alanine amidase [Phycisphaeraceae bacterium]MCW5762917.1 N-acetylmuramoyl-L-alanine amidase [Phycisphaeraceae bacterium]
MKISRSADMMDAVDNFNRRQWIAHAIACGTLTSLSAILGACGSTNARRGTTASQIGKPIPANPVPASGAAGSSSVALGSAGSIPSGVLPRSRWTRVGPDPRLADPMRGISHITVHHDGMPPVALNSMAACASRIETIRNGHRSKGWADIGYHYVIDPEGRVWEGRTTTLQGAHVKDQNPGNLGILVLGNFEQQQPTPRALTALDQFLIAQSRQYRIPASRIYTHQELAPTACPGRNLQRYMDQTRSRGGRVASA